MPDTNDYKDVNFPSISEALAKLHHDDIRDIISRGLTYIAIFWNGLEIIDSNGMRRYHTSKLLIIKSKHGTMTPEYARFIVKNVHIYQEGDQLFVKLIDNAVAVIPDDNDPHFNYQLSHYSDFQQK